MANETPSVLPLEPGLNGGPDTHHTHSPTAISFVPSETATLGEGAGSSFTTGKGAHLDGLPETGPLPPTMPSSGGHVPVPNIAVPQEHETRRHRTLVLCFDGTGDQFDNDNSNIVELFSNLKKDDPDRQMVYYQAGIGTYTVPQIATPFFAKVSKTMDEMIAWNLDAHIMGGYEFLMQNYKGGDKISIFGFSRGAYTARCLAGMIHKVGLLPACNHQQVPFAYKMYTRNDAIGFQQSKAFKAAFSCHVDIDFLGVWDTVNSVGLVPRRLPFTASNTCVRVFRHAIALDERRTKFRQNSWNQPGPKKSKSLKKKGEKSLKELERENSDLMVSTNVEEVWFAGCHCDVGGGSVTNGMRPNLARIPLRWMIRQTFATNTGIVFYAQGLRRIGLDLDEVTWCPKLERPPPLKAPEGSFISRPERAANLTYEQHEKMIKEMAAEELRMSEREIDLRDALSPIYDQLKLAPFWWLLEYLPMKHQYQKADDEWNTLFGINMGKGRRIPRQKKDGVRVHRSVQVRSEAAHADGTKYSPKAKNLKPHRIIWVD